jgi:type III secretion protein I
MIDALVSSGALASSGASATTVQANLSDVERFRAAMVSTQTQAAPATLEKSAVAAAAQQSVQVQPPASEVGKASLGDTILTTLQDLSTDTKQRFGQVGELLSKPEINMSELMSLQYTLLQTSLQFELASKGISKFTQNLDSVLKTS